MEIQYDSLGRRCGIKFSNADKKDIISRIQAGESARSVSKSYQCSEKTIRRRYTLWTDDPKFSVRGYKRPKKNTTPEISNRIDLSKYSNRFRTSRELKDEIDERNYLEMDFGEEPFAIYPCADIHLGNRFCDIENFLKHMDIIDRTDRFWMIWGGDAIDNFILSGIKTAMMKNPTPIDEQWELLGEIIKTYGSSILAIISGNHELWTQKAAGVDPLKMLTQQTDILYDQAEFFFEFHCGPKQIYKLGIRHKYKYGSNFNLTHTVKRWWEHNSRMDFDIGVICHHHVPDYEIFFKRGSKKLAIRTGTYKLYDSYAKEIGVGGRSYECFPCIIFIPKIKDFIVVDSPQIASKLIRIAKEDETFFTL